MMARFDNAKVNTKCCVCGKTTITGELIQIVIMDDSSEVYTCVDLRCGMSAERAWKKANAR